MRTTSNLFAPMPRKTTNKQTSDKNVQKKVRKVMHEFKEGELHSGSKKGPVVRSKKQAIAIALSEAGASNKTKRSRRTIRKKSS